MNNGDQLDKLTNSPAALKADFFNDELDLIEDDNLRAMVRTALDAAPAYFWTEPCSVTGKYHPSEDNTVGGIPIHSAKTAWLAYRIADVQYEEPGTVRDAITGAALLHDICCKGSGDAPDKDSWKTHGEVAYEWLEQFGDPDNHDWILLRDCVRYHMGRFGKATGYNLPHQIVEHADAAASCKHFVSVKFYNPDAAPAVSDLKSKGYLYKDDNDNWIIGFGKYKDSEKKLDDLAAENASYLRYILDKTDFLAEDEVATIQKAIDVALSKRIGEAFGYEA